jgi:hypothetical protein
VDESRRVAVESDPVVLKAVEVLPKARILQENARKQIVQRRAQQQNSR